jgi:lipoprotein signal peptidase
MGAENHSISKNFSGRSALRSSAIWSLAFFILIVVDQLVKLQFPPFRNYGFAFGIPLSPWLMYFFYAVVVIILLAYFFRHRKEFSFSQNIAWLLIFAGSAANIGERIWLGYVRDFLYLPGGSVINVADIYITAGLIVLLFFKTNLKKP